MIEAWIPRPQHQEIDTVEVSASPSEAYALCRHLDLGRSPLTRLLFRLRTLPDLFRAPEPEILSLSLDDLTSPGQPGFRIIEDRPGEVFVVGAIAKPWEAEIPFLAIAPEDFISFSEPGWARIAWSLRFEPTIFGTRIEIALRFDTTNSEAMLKLERYYRLIGPFSHFIRRHLLSLVARELGMADHNENHLSLPGDTLLNDARVQITHGITLQASPEQIWPWLVQMGCHRAGWYSYDSLDNGGEPSAETILPEFQNLKPGDELALVPIGDARFTVLELEADHALVLGSCFDLDAESTVPFCGGLPKTYLRDTWAFVLDPVSPDTTRLLVRVRADYGPDWSGLRAFWMLPLHHLMEHRQLQNLKRRVEASLTITA